MKPINETIYDFELGQWMNLTSYYTRLRNFKDYDFINHADATRDNIEIQIGARIKDMIMSELEDKLNMHRIEF